MDYQPAEDYDTLDLRILAASGPEPPIDPVLGDFLTQSNCDLQERASRGGLLHFRSLGVAPWLYRLTFATHGLARDGAQGEIQPVAQHTVALRFLPDYLRRADRFEMLRLLDPKSPPIFHPNICPRSGAICVEIYPGEGLVEIVESLHDLFRWRLRQYDERDALNKAACAWGRAHVQAPIDDRPLFGQRLKIDLDPVGD